MATDSQQIPDQFKCPICVDIPEEEIYQCKNGHIICSSCYRSVTDCPQCRVKFKVDGILIRNRALESFLESIPVRCPFEERGCQERILRKDLPTHKANCIHSGKTTQLCKRLGYNCSHWTNTAIAQNYAHHFKTCHDASEAHLHQSCSVKIEMSRFNEEILGLMQSSNILGSSFQSNKIGTWNPIILNHCDGSKFIAFTHFHGNEKTVSWTCLPLNINKKFECQYEVEFRIEDDSKKLPTLAWTMQVQSIDCYSEDNIELSPFKLSVPTLQKYINRTNGALTIIANIQTVTRPTRNYDTVNLSGCSVQQQKRMHVKEILGNIAKHQSGYPILLLTLTLLAFLLAAFTSNSFGMMLAPAVFLFLCCTFFLPDNFTNVR